MATYTQDITKLLKQAKVNDIIIPISQRISGNQTVTTRSSVINNIISHHVQITLHAVDLFDSAIGYYRSAYKEAFNPLFWIETLVFLPRSIMSYIGIDNDKLSSKALNVIFTAFWWLTCTFLAYFKSEIINLIQAFLQKLT
jgi:hypothetical protein